MKKLFIILTILFLTVAKSFATTLPPELTTYIRTQVPNATIRFDGLVIFPDKTTYLPLIPALSQSVEKLEVTYSHPKNLVDLKKKPEILVFNNNYVLLKVIKDKNGVTISKATDYPITVKTGVLPQDMLVPKGLFIPESLEGILGDLKIPVGNQASVVTKKNVEETHDETTDFLDKKIPVTVPKVEALKNKLYFVSNYDLNYLRVIDSNNTQPLYSLKLESIPRSIIPVNDNKYILIIAGGKTYVDIVDVQREEIAKQIDLTIEPSEAVEDAKNKIAYVAAKNEDAIFIIDLRSMELKQKIIIKGCPVNLSINEKGDKLIYQDKNTTNLYVVYPNRDYATESLIPLANLSKVITTNNAVYAISRTRNQLYVLSYPEIAHKIENSTPDISIKDAMSPASFTSILNPQTVNLPGAIENLIMAKKNVVEKPVDMLMYNDKLYILGAKQNQLSVYDIKTNTILKTIDLPMGGFSKKLTRVDKTNYVVISNAREEKYLIFDLDTLSTVQQVPVNTKINNLVIIKNLQAESKK